MNPLRPCQLYHAHGARPLARKVCLARVLFLALLTLAVTMTSVQAQQRALGLDISAWQGNISQTTWDNIRNVENRQFVILRSSRGGTTGYYNQNDSDNSEGKNTNSQRYDDPYFVQNINRAAAAGMFVGSYHFSRPEIIASTPNSGGVANTGTDEADHFIQMAGAWMRPGYLMPVHDFEAGDGVRTDDQLTQFCLDFSNRIYERMGIRPAIYVNGNYAAFILGTASAALRHQIAQPAGTAPNPAAPAYPTLWSARWPNQADPNSIDVQNGEPKDSYTSIYGPWDDYGVTHPWAFWQYASTGRLQSFNNGGSNLDLDVARGGVEFLKDNMVPAIWVHNGNGDWNTLTNWNSGLAPVAPVTGPGQVPPVGTQAVPVPRLPGAAGTGVTNGLNDTVLLDRPNTNITVTLASGSHNIRKLYMRETLNLTGGALTINYVPSADSTPMAAQFSGPVTLSGNASLSVHTLQVDATRTFTLSGGTLTLNTVQLMPDSTTPAKLTLAGDVSLNPLANATATMVNGSGAGNSGLVDLGGASRALNVGNGAAEVDLSLDIPISNGGLAKAGPGTLRLTAGNLYSAGTTVSAGRLLVNNVTGSGTGTGGVNVNGGILGGTGMVAGVVTVASGGTVAPGMASAMGRLVFNSPPSLAGTNFMRIDRNGVLTADRLIVSSGTLNYGGTLVVSNAGLALLGGEVFTNFSAVAYAGAFASMVLPQLGGGLNWYTASLTTNGTIKVNRSPVAGLLTFTNVAPNVLQIPISSLTAAAADADGDVVRLSGVQLVTTNGITLVTNSTFILYSNYVSAIDRFSYTLTDGRGGSATGAVQITSSPIGRFVAMPQYSGNSATLQFAGRPGWTYYLERATNLPPAWLTIATNVAPASGVFGYTDGFPDLPAPPPWAFYRLRW